MKKLFALSMLLPTMLASSLAGAEPRIFLNDVDITYVRNQLFKDVNQVSIDAEGNVIIHAPQYKISERTYDGVTQANSSYVAPEGTKYPSSQELETARCTLPNDPKPTYLVANFNYPGLLGYNIDVYINGKFVKTVSHEEAQTAIDVSSFLHKGKNHVQYRMVLAPSAGLASKATAEFFFAKATQNYTGAVELSGNVAATQITTTDTKNVYDLDLFNP